MKKIILIFLMIISTMLIYGQAEYPYMSVVANKGMSLGRILNAGVATNYLVEANNGSIYYFYLGSSGSGETGGAIYYKKSSDKGRTWGAGTKINATTEQGYAIATWYDRWSGVNADLIHVAWTGTTGDNCYYRTINTASSDALGTERTPFDSTLNITSYSQLTITEGRGGYLMIVGLVPTTPFPGFSKISTDGGATWTSASRPTESVQSDFYLLNPGFAADQNDLILIYADASASEVSKKLFDWSAGTWSETSIATSISLPAYASGYNTPIGVSVDVTNSCLLVAFWNAPGSVNGDLLAYKITESSNTALTNVINNLTASAYVGTDVGTCINSSDGSYYVMYNGSASGGEYQNYGNTYYKKSTDGGSTWGNEVRMSDISVNTFLLYTTNRTALSYPIVNLITSNYTHTICATQRIKKIAGIEP